LISVKVVLVGPSSRRARLRPKLPDTLEVVADADTLSEARRLRDVDAYLVAAAPERDDEDAPPIEPLTSRELEVLDTLADGLSNKAIAARLGISDETVKFHLSAIFGKLQASNRTDAVRQAVRRGLVEL
jgi:DNA-binding NarL/FixJ family response regulator